jgi:hypothetical protein
VRARLRTLESAEAATLDAALAADSPSPSAAFDATARAMIDAARAAEDDALDALLADDDVRPSADFDARFAARLAATDDAALDTLLALDAPRPSTGFDATFKARLAHAETVPDTQGAKVVPFRGRSSGKLPGKIPNQIIWFTLVTAAAAALFLALRPTPVMQGSTPAEPVLAAYLPQLEMLEDMEMFEHLDAIEVLDGLEDPAVFALVAPLDTLDIDPLPEPLPSGGRP